MQPLHSAEGSKPAPADAVKDVGFAGDTGPQRSCRQSQKMRKGAHIAQSAPRPSSDASRAGEVQCPWGPSGTCGLGRCADFTRSSLKTVLLCACTGPMKFGGVQHCNSSPALPAVWLVSMVLQRCAWLIQDSNI